MKRKTSLVVVLSFLVLATVYAEPQAGSWTFTRADYSAGYWKELLWGGGESAPGNEFQAESGSYRLQGALLESMTLVESMPMTDIFQGIYSGGVLVLGNAPPCPWVNPADGVSSFAVNLGTTVMTMRKVSESSGVPAGPIDFLVEAEGEVAGYPGCTVAIKLFYDGIPGVDDPLDLEPGAVFGDLSWVEITITAAPPSPPTLPDLLVDIKPGSAQNPVNLTSKGVLPVAIMGTADFDVTDIDPATIRLEGVAPLRWWYADLSVADPEAGEDAIAVPDGFMDLKLKFSTRQLAAVLGTPSRNDRLELTLTAERLDGTVVQGTDTIRVLKNNRKPKLP